MSSDHCSDYDKIC